MYDNVFKVLIACLFLQILFPRTTIAIISSKIHLSSYVTKCLNIGIYLEWHQESLRRSSLHKQNTGTGTNVKNSAAKFILWLIQNRLFFIVYAPDLMACETWTHAMKRRQWRIYSHGHANK